VTNKSFPLNIDPPRGFSKQHAVDIAAEIAQALLVFQQPPSISRFCFSAISPGAKHSTGA
jgi:hypothetical protein